MLMRIIAGAALASRPKGVAIMARMGFVAAASASAVLLSTYGACAAERVAGVGDVVLRVEKTEPLPNVFGGPDIFGRRRPTGVDMIQFMGLRDGKAVFVRSGVAIQSNATTLTESPRYVPTPSFGTFSGQVGGSYFHGTQNSYGGTWLPPRGSTSAEIPLAPIEIDVDWRTNPIVVLDGHRLRIDAADQTTLTYAILK
jgi:hypothetical protein